MDISIPLSESASESVEYRNIEGYPGYRIGSDGSVWSCWEKTAQFKANGQLAGALWLSSEKWKRLKHKPNRTGYPRVALYRDGKQSLILVHLLVLRNFIGPCPPGENACHENDIKTDCRLANLRWDTPQANWEDRKRNGRMTLRYGEAHHYFKATTAQVVEMRERYTAGETVNALAERFSFSVPYVRAIVTGRSRLHG